MELGGLQFGDGGPRMDSLIGMGWPKGLGYPEMGTWMSDGVYPRPGRFRLCWWRCVESDDSESVVEGVS